MQVWVHESVVGDRTAILLRQVDLVRRLLAGATLAEALPAAGMPDDRTQWSYDFVTSGDWIVVHSGTWGSAGSAVPADPERLADVSGGQ
jgi:hypothetical protein